MRVVLLCLFASLWCGCFVFDELDNGMKIMEAHTPRDVRAREEAKKKGEKGGKAAAEGEKPVTYAEKVGGWWQNAKSLSSQPNASSEPFVQCAARGETFYAKKSDCIARGGRPS